MLFAQCKGWSCWESQLRDLTRIKIVEIYNKFRNDVARGQCNSCEKNQVVSNIFELVRILKYCY